VHSVSRARAEIRSELNLKVLWGQEIGTILMLQRNRHIGSVLHLEYFLFELKITLTSQAGCHNTTDTIPEVLVDINATSDHAV
jgi:hypothetical protein